MDNKIGIIGLGRLGLCFALTLEKNGYNVVGVDVNQEYVDLINTKRLKSPEPSVEEYLKLSKNFRATTSLEETISHSNDLFVVVATPSLSTGKYDHSQVNTIISQLEKLGKASCRKNFIVCCTVMPGYCDSIKDRLDKLNYVVSYNPEFIAQGCILHNQANPDMVLIGEGSPEAGKRLEEIYHKICKNLPAYCRMKSKSAEITKIALNCFITMKIAYANSVGDIATLAGAEPEKILDAIGSDRRVGHAYFKYGYGFGGPCVKPYTFLQTSEGLKQIRDIKVGDKVFTHRGRLRKVTKIYERPYKGDMIQYKISGHCGIPLEATLGHPVYGCKVIYNHKTSEYQYYCAKEETIKTRKSYMIAKSKEDFLAIENYRVGDLIAMPSVKVQSPGKQAIVLKNREIEITSELMKFFGFYLSEGCVSHSSAIRRNDRILFTFHAKERDYAEFIVSMFSKYFDRKASIRQHGKNSIRVVAKHIPLAEWLKDTFGRGAIEKRVPISWLGLDKIYLTELLRGIWYGDGSTSTNVYTYATISHDLFNFVKLAMGRFCIAMGTSIKQPYIGLCDGTPHKMSYWIRVSNPVYINMMNELLPNMRIDIKTKSRKTIWFEDSVMYSKIKDIHRHYYDGVVYNLEVEEDESYMLESSVVHNCFPRDARALGIFALENSGYNIKLAKATDEANKYHLNAQLSIYMENNPDKNKEVVMESVTFKPGTIIIEESQQLLFAVGLARSGYKVIIKEVPEVVEQVQTLYGDLFTYETRP